MTEKIETGQKKKLPAAVICDLDGCISLFNHISKEGETSNQHYHPGAHSRHSIDAETADRDLPNKSVVEVIKMAYTAGYTIIFCSGRIDKYEQQTRSFLTQHLRYIPYQLFLRRDGDFRKDNVLKEEVYRSKIEPYYEVLFVLEDRDVCVQMFRSIGLNCWQVYPGNF
jgi:hypothetical protein